LGDMLVQPTFQAARLGGRRALPVRPSVIKTPKMECGCSRGRDCRVYQKTEWGAARMANINLGVLGSFRLETSAGEPVLFADETGQSAAGIFGLAYGKASGAFKACCYYRKTAATTERWEAVIAPRDSMRQ
jgi:hypothetical protein